MRNVSLYASFVGAGFMVFGLATYILAIFLPVLEDPLETIVIVSAFAAPMLGFLLTLPHLLGERSNWRTLLITVYITAYYMFLLFVGG